MMNLLDESHVGRRISKNLGETEMLFVGDDVMSFVFKVQLFQPKAFPEWVTKSLGGGKTTALCR